MNEHNNVMLKAIMAGLFIGIAGLIFLSVENRVIGAILFSFGLLMVVSKGYYLYTGRVGYLFPYEKGYLLIMGKTLLGNFIGITSVGLLFRFSGMTDVIVKANELFYLKTDNLWYETLVLSILCGMMMYIGVQSYRVMKLDILKVLMVIFAVVIFILAKFEHSVANMLYIAVGNTWSLKALLYVFIWVIGNGIGSIILNLVEVKLSKE
ncbi:MAG: formate/nitrite transporter family protein [Acholeplasmataceae bacterium]|nr:formate/nitrite transporter family protein [Acholeplasmataceae bacterium]